MKITFLGTAAAEGWPALFCECETCKAAKKLGGKDIRSRSQSLINDDLLIDFPPDTYMHTIYNGLDLNPVKNVIITHNHEDHLLPCEFAYRRAGFSGTHEPHMLNVYGDDAVYNAINRYFAETNQAEGIKEGVTFHQWEAYTENAIGGYTIYPVLANHNPAEKCLFYVIRDHEGKTLLYAHDTGYFPAQTWEFLQQFRFDFVSLDCTAGLLDCENGHMGIKCCAKVKDRLLAMGCADDQTKFVLHHFSHNGLFLTHEQMCQEGANYGFEIAYDGKSVTF